MNKELYFLFLFYLFKKISLGIYLKKIENILITNGFSNENYPIFTKKRKLYMKR